jgi:mono/diheme cytochrome c family protein
MKCRWMVTILSLALLPGLSATGAMAQEGKRVTELKCAECHGAPGPLHDIAPSFSEIAQDPEVNRQFLEKFLGQVIQMPTYRLTAAERTEVIDYILSLKSAH